MSDESSPAYVTIKMSERHLGTTIREWLRVNLAHERSGKWPSTEFCWAPQRCLMVDLEGYVWVDLNVECRPNSAIHTHPVRLTITPDDDDGFTLEANIEHCQDKWTKRPLEGRREVGVDVLVG